MGGGNFEGGRQTDRVVFGIEAVVFCLGVWPFSEAARTADGSSAYFVRAKPPSFRRFIRNGRKSV